MSKTRLLVGVLPLLLSGVGFAADLPLGETVTGRAKDGQPAEYNFAAESAGVLLVVVRGDEDVVLSVVNSIGRPVEDGRIDGDYGGDAGAEQGAIVIGRPGDYTVRVEPFGFGSLSFVLGATWLPMDAVARDPDPHGSPEDAIVMEAGKNLEEVLSEENGDREDWYRFEAKSDGLLTVATRSESGDLVLECYRKDAYGEAVERSDADIGGDSGRESIAIDVETGDVFFFVVSTFFGDAEYSIRGVLTDN